MLKFKGWLKRTRLSLRHQPPQNRSSRNTPRPQRQWRRPFLWALLIIIAFSCAGGWSVTQISSVRAVEPTKIIQTSSGTVDTVPSNLDLAQETYLAQCATCHIGIPPAVLPSETWQTVLQDTNHYGVPWEPLRNPELALTWKYLRSFSRPLNPEEAVPYRTNKSRYFKILHPRVEFTEPVTVGTCVSCHPGAPKFNFRDLTSKWKDAP
jgi:mono/diheme cytochrome c family protein